MRQWRSGLVMAACLVGALGVAVPATAAAAPVITDLLHVQSGQCLDASVSTGVRLNTCNGGSYQRWDLQGSQLRHVQSGLCLDGSVSGGVRLNACNGGAYQQWFSPNGLDFVHGQSGLCLDGSVSGGVRLKACNGSSYQEWID